MATNKKYPIYFRSTNRVKGIHYYHAVLTSNRTVTAIHDKNNHMFSLSTCVNYLVVKKILEAKHLKRISGEQFYNNYLMIRRSLNKQCINVIKSLNLKEQTK